MYKVAFKNLGCKVNSYETEKMRDNIPHNFCEVDFKKKADIYIINTCSVTHVADRKSRQMIHQAIKRNENAKVYVCGCYVNNLILCDPQDNIICKNNIVSKNSNGQDVYDNQKEVECDNSRGRIVCDPKNTNIKYIINEKKCNIWEYIKEQCVTQKSNQIYDTNDEKICSMQKDKYEEDRIRGFLKIEDGCDNFCSYCIIPYLRGRIQSRNIDDIVKDAKVMVKKGKKEIVLTGIDINAYGKEKGRIQCDHYNERDKSYNCFVWDALYASRNTGNTGVKRLETNHLLLDVIKEVCKIDGVIRVRVGSLHPLTITDEFVKELKKEEKFCPEFHLSLQSGSDEVLKNMNRKYTTHDYERAVSTIRKYYKNATITTDIIVGFPIESDKNFIETCDFVKKIKFYNPHIFKYSIRKGTVAANMTQVDENIKDKREKELIKLSKKISDDIRKQQVGQIKEVLVEEIKIVDDKKVAVGFTKEYMKVKVNLDRKSDDVINNIVGTIIKVKIVKSKK